jgi:hypothetical protein
VAIAEPLADPSGASTWQRYRPCCSPEMANISELPVRYPHISIFYPQLFDVKPLMMVKILSLQVLFRHMHRLKKPILILFKFFSMIIHLSKANSYQKSYSQQ